MKGYHRKQTGTAMQDFIEVACAFGVAVLILWAMLVSLSTMA
jgi:hypothetical protein